MIKSVFGKFMLAFVLIITVCLSMLLMVMYGIVNNYATDVKMDSARQLAEAVREYMQSEVQNGEPMLPADQGDVEWMLRLATTSTDHMLIILTDAEGVPVASQSNYSVEISKDFKLPEDSLKLLKSGKEVSSIQHFHHSIKDSQLAYALPVMNGERMVGAVIVSSPSARWSGLLNVMARTIVMASLWIMLAALIAVYFVSERVSAPLREMRRAVKEFAEGDFDRRVAVHGDDEVAELGMAFNQMAQALENTEKTRSSFVANVSHDLRSPMTTIAGFIDAIRDGVIPPEKQGHYLNLISDEVHRLSRLVSSLLDVTRIEAGERKFVMKPFDICEMGRQILISFEQRIEQKRLSVEFVCENDSMMVLADHDAIYQVLYNLCDNAVKFSQDEGVLRITLDRVSQDERGKKGRIRASVYNQGQGIAPEDLPLVFERFYKGDKSRGLDRRGTGLGLYICKTIVAAHGEDIWVTSVEGKDCQFTFTIKEAVL